MPPDSRAAQKILILHGAVDENASLDEQDVLTEVNAVSAALENLGYASKSLALTLDLESARISLVNDRPWLIFNLVESLNGSGRLIHLAPAIFEELGIAFTGSPLSSLFMSSNKLLAKRLLAAFGVATPEICVAGRIAEDACSNDRWIIKSVWEHASIGLDENSVVHNHEIMSRILSKQDTYGGDWFAECYIEGREFNLALLASDSGEPEVLPPAEIRFQHYPEGKPRIVDYSAKWETGSFEYSHTARCFDFSDADQPMLKAMKEIALQCWELFECQGYARVDFRVDEAGRPWVLELNTNPCLAPDAGFAAAALQAGIPYETVIDRILAATIGLQKPIQTRPDSLTGSHVSYS